MYPRPPHTYQPPTYAHIVPSKHDNIKQYDYFQPQSGPTHVPLTSHLANPSYQDGPPGHCPHCLKGINFFQLPQEISNTVFCSSCKQPYHRCPIHQTAIRGMGINFNDPQSTQCQCNYGQSFLGDDRWDSCFH